MVRTVGEKDFAHKNEWINQNHPPELNVPFQIQVKARVKVSLLCRCAIQGQTNNSSEIDLERENK